ncbi:MAG: hypothetical protein Q4D98_14685 [Planctomycetia bacterium]|nr:hypothetical protein [Planctomycetia bacterium]
MGNMGAEDSALLSRWKSRVAAHFARRFSECDVPVDLQPRLSCLLARFRTALPLPERAAIFTRLAACAARHAQTLHLCTYKNPNLPADFFGVQKFVGCEITGGSHSGLF